MTIRLLHNKVELALHELRTGSGRPLLLLHGLGEATPAALPDRFEPWPGPVFGLDFTGHGDSDLPVGGGYYCEVLMADVDAVIAHLGPLTVHGSGLGAYIALLIAGARPDDVRGAILDDGPGLAGGGPEPASPSVLMVEPATRTPDPLALIELTRDVRPPDYAQSFVRQASHLSGLDQPLTVCARTRPAWLAAVAAEPGVATAELSTALGWYSAI